MSESLSDTILRLKQEKADLTQARKETQKSLKKERSYVFRSELLAGAVALRAYDKVGFFKDILEDHQARNCFAEEAHR